VKCISKVGGLGGEREREREREREGKREKKGERKEEEEDHKERQNLFNLFTHLFYHSTKMYKHTEIFQSVLHLSVDKSTVFLHTNNAETLSIPHTMGCSGFTFSSEKDPTQTRVHKIDPNSNEPLTVY
jgi:hypothetical protein